MSFANRLTMSSDGLIIKINESLLLLKLIGEQVTKMYHLGNNICNKYILSFETKDFLCFPDGVICQAKKWLYSAAAIYATFTSLDGVMDSGAN